MWNQLFFVGWGNLSVVEEEFMHFGVVAQHTEQHWCDRTDPRLFGIFGLVLCILDTVVRDVMHTVHKFMKQSDFLLIDGGSKFDIDG